MVRGNLVLHYLKFFGLLAVVIMIWLTSERNIETPHFSTGQPKATGGFINGKAEGIWTWWYESGKKMTEGNFKDGKRNGTWRTWYENGSKKSESTYRDDKLYGLYTVWYRNGGVKQVGNFKDDERNGFQQYYDTSGLLLEKRFFVKGLLAPEN